MYHFSKKDDSRKESGFTLAELMAAIVIISILSALTAAQFSNAMHKARTAIVPLGISQIITAEEAYFAEHRVYQESPWKDSNNDDINDNLEKNLGLRLRSKYWEFKTVAQSKNRYQVYYATARMRWNRNYGGIADDGRALIDQDGKKEIRDSNNKLPKYLMGWYNN